MNYQRSYVIMMMCMMIQGDVLFSVPFASLPRLCDISSAINVPGAITWYRVGSRIVPVVCGMYESWHGLRVEDSTFIMRVRTYTRVM